MDAVHKREASSSGLHFSQTTVVLERKRTKHGKVYLIAYKSGCTLVMLSAFEETLAVREPFFFVMIRNTTRRKSIPSLDYSP